MSAFYPSRRIFPSMLAALVLAAVVAAQAQPLGGQKGNAVRVSGQHPSTQPSPHAGASPKQQNQEHLAQWMDRHSNLPLVDQQRALQQEPGFRDLPPQTQQRMLDRLSQLNSMPPEKRRRIIDRNEAMAHLTPPQRQQVRGAMQQLGSLPEDRRRLVARAFRDLREMPEPQRQAILSSDRFRGQFSDQERNTLSSLLAVEPFLPVQRPNDAPDFGK